MPIIGDNEKAIVTILRRRNPKDGSTSSAPMKSEVVKKEDTSVDGRHVAAQDAIMAMHEKSPEKLMQALANFMDLHMMKEPDTEEPPVEE